MRAGTGSLRMSSAPVNPQSTISQRLPAASVHFPCLRSLARLTTAALPLHGRAFHVVAFHLKRAGESRTQCDWRHFRRLAGFTNQKKERRLLNGFQPFVRLRGNEGYVYSAANEFLREMEALKREQLSWPEPRALVRPRDHDAPVRRHYSRPWPAPISLLECTSPRRAVSRVHWG